MGFADRLRAWFKGETRRAPVDPTTDRASRAGTKELEEFIRSRVGVEAYLEPKTAVYSTTLLLVADDGEYLRRPVKDQAQAAALCDRTSIPLYDARRVGYPRRMKDYDRGVRPGRVDLADLPPWPGDEPPSAEGPPPPPAEVLEEADDPPAAPADGAPTPDRPPAEPAECSESTTGADEDPVREDDDHLPRAASDGTDPDRPDRDDGDAGGTPPGESDDPGTTG